MVRADGMTIMKAAEIATSAETAEGTAAGPLRPEFKLDPSEEQYILFIQKRRTNSEWEV